jgi:hypothetical protein
MKEPRVYGLVLDRIDVLVDLPVELVPGIFLQRATSQQVTCMLPTIGDYDRNLPRAFSHETGPEGGELRPIEAERWRFYLVDAPASRFAEDGPTIENTLFELSKASRLATVELPCEYLVFGVTRDGELKEAMRRTSLLGRPECFLVAKKPLPFDGECLRQLRAVWAQLRKLDRQHWLRQSLDMYFELRPMMRTGLYALSVFALIEGILTHSPAFREEMVKRQITNKLNLLNKRFEIPIDYACFPNSDPGTVWANLQNLRNTIAHGGRPDFHGELADLGGHEVAVDFLDQVVKKLLRHALKEPELITDLREC